jgi:RNA polymerase sigma-70 factor (ECF subfamily)
MKKIFKKSDKVLVLEKEVDSSFKSDESLVEEFLNDFNKVDSFEELLNRYEPKLNRYIRSLGVEQNLAKDVVQESFIKAYRNIRSFNPKKGKWSSWIYRIAHNCAMDSFKKSNKDLTVDEDEWWDGIAVPENITSELNLKLDVERLAKLMSKLDVKYRHPLNLYFLDGKSYKEISAILRLPTATVSTRIKRGKEKIVKLSEQQNLPKKTKDSETKIKKNKKEKQDRPKERLKAKKEKMSKKSTIKIPNVKLNISEIPKHMPHLLKKNNKSETKNKNDP